MTVISLKRDFLTKSIISINSSVCYSEKTNRALGESPWLWEETERAALQKPNGFHYFSQFCWWDFDTVLVITWESTRWPYWFSLPEWQSVHLPGRQQQHYWHAVAAERDNLLLLYRSHTDSRGIMHHIGTWAPLVPLLNTWNQKMDPSLQRW